MVHDYVAIFLGRVHKINCPTLYVRSSENAVQNKSLLFIEAGLEMILKCLLSVKAFHCIIVFAPVTGKTKAAMGFYHRHRALLAKINAR